MGLLIGLPLKLFHFFFIIIRFAWPLLLIALIWYLRRRRRDRPVEDQAPPAKEPKFDGPVYTVDYEEVDEED